MIFKINNISEKALVLLLLGLIMYLSYFVRSTTLNAQTVLDYDPWWYYRHALEIINNNYKPLQWDILSHYPPGRPYDYQLGSVYTMIIFFKIASVFFNGISFLKVAMASPIIMVALSVIPAYFLGKLLSNNKWSGITTALFAVLAPTFIGVSMAGYTDNDPVVVFYTFLTVLSMFLALEKKTIPYYIFAIVSNILFAFNWGGGWFVMMLFTAFLPALFVFRIFEDMIHQKKLRVDITHTIKELKSLLPPLAIVFLSTNVLGYILGLGNIISSLLISFGFINLGQGLLVNISVAELQPLSIFTKEGFYAVANRVGLAPIVLMLLLPPIVLYKIYKKVKINYTEVFLFLWASVTFYMIMKGVRFSLSFSIAAAVIAGYVIGNLVKSLRRDVVGATVFGVITLLILMFVSNAIQYGYASTGMEVSQNWIDGLTWLKQNADKNSLVVTWWDPGHIIAGSTGLKVMADGAHCGECKPYNHNVRIQDMGRSFSTDSEDEAIQILQKYRGLTPQQCSDVKKTFGEMGYDVPDEACSPISEMYVIASNDLIGKYYWMSYFGDCLRQYGVKNAETCYNIGPTWFMKNAQGRNFIQLSLSNQDQQGNLIYGRIVTLTQKDKRIVPIINVPQQGIRNALIKQIVYFQQDGKPVFDEFTNVTNAIDGMLWVDPSFRAVIFMDASIRDSLFTRMFFWNGQGLQKFELKYSNPELRIFKVKFD